MESAYVMDPPTKVITPYGGRLVWVLPGGNSLVVHLKDKQKIRHRKRWSQVNLSPPPFPPNTTEIFMTIIFLVNSMLVEIMKYLDFFFVGNVHVLLARLQIVWTRNKHAP